MHVIHRRKASFQTSDTHTAYGCSVFWSFWIGSDPYDSWRRRQCGNHRKTGTSRCVHIGNTRTFRPFWDFSWTENNTFWIPAHRNSGTFVLYPFRINPQCRPPHHPRTRLWVQYTSYSEQWPFPHFGRQPFCRLRCWKLVKFEKHFPRLFRWNFESSNMKCTTYSLAKYLIRVNRSETFKFHTWN